MAATTTIITSDYESMEHASAPPTTANDASINNNNNNNRQSTTTAAATTMITMTAKRVKANGYFLIGSILYLPPSIWDVILATNHNNDNDGSTSSYVDDRSTEQELLYNILVGGAILAYIGNGIVEIQIAYKDYEDLLQNHNLAAAQKSRQQQDYVANATLFALAACIEMVSIVSLHTKWLMKVSSQLYLLNALFTLWLSRESYDDTSTTISGKIVYCGDVLFLVGAIIDMIGGYLELHDETISPVLIAWAWLASSIAWFLDAICYLTAALLDHYYYPDASNHNNTTTGGRGIIQMRDLPPVV